MARLALAAAAGISASRAALANPPTSDSNDRLVFADEFNGTSLGTSRWAAASPSWTMPNSDSTATASDVSVANGMLTLTATRTGNSTFQSGSISSYNLYNFSGGYVEARIQLPSTPGSWPAFWGLYTGWPPEADIMEYPLTSDGGTSGLASNQYNTNYHYTNSSGDAAAGAGPVTTSQSLAGTWHTFGMDWISNTSVAFYLDGNEVSSYTGASVSQMASMYMILDYAVGGWPGTPSTTQWPIGFSDQMNVDWVRVWQTNPNNDAPTTWNVNGGGSFATASNWTGGVPSYGNEVAIFGRVGSAATASISMNSWQLFGGITFDGNASGTTAYTLGSSSNEIQLATTVSSGVTVQATSASTASQTINAGVELWSNTTFQNNMTGGEPIVLNGVLSGAGNCTVIGPAPVQFSNNNTYTGNTFIGTASTPAGTAVVTRSSPFGTSGIVYLGMQGNANAALIQIENNRSVPNTIEFAGRGASTTNNVTAGIENLSGNNSFTGTINLVKGGANYIIQSDGGLLTLWGSTDASTPGVAMEIDPSAGGSRTVTLQGSGNGTVAGVIQNGTGTLSITKAGSGMWSLGGVNTYTGLTNVNGGMLFANNATSSLGTGVVNVNSGGTLAGNGTITNASNALTVNAGGTVAAGATASSIGKLTTGGQTWNGNGSYAWKIGVAGSAGAAPGSGGSGSLDNGSGVEGGSWDNLAMRILTLNSVANTSPFYIALSGNPTGAAYGNYSWVIAQTTNTSASSINGNITAGDNLLAQGSNSQDAGLFALSTSSLTFDGVTGPSSSLFSLKFETVNGGSNLDLVLDYTSAPEPGSGLLALTGGLPMLLGRRRQRSARRRHELL